MAVKGIGSNYLYPVQNDYKLDSKTEDTKNAVSQTAVQKEGVSYEKTIPDSVSAGLEYIQGLEKQISGTKFFVGTVSYGQTYGNSSDINFVVNPKFLGNCYADFGNYLYAKRYVRVLRRRNDGMNIAGMGAVYSAMYQHTAKVQNTATDKTSFSHQLQNAGSVGKTEVEAYTDYLKSKYGNVSIQSIGKDQASLDRVGRGMSGSDVIIAPNILEQMATDSDKAAYYENKIDYYFNMAIPRDTLAFASKGLVYEPGGVVVHEDGTVTYISGCSDSPERVAEVEAEHEAKREAEAKMREESLERSREAAEEQKQVREYYYKKELSIESIYSSFAGVNLRVQ